MPKKLTIEGCNSYLHRVKLVQKGEKLYIKGTFPNKDGKSKNKQYEISTQLGQAGLNIAFERAKRIEADLNLNQFHWSDWIDVLPADLMSCEEAIRRYEEFYWETRKRTKARENEFLNVYLRFLRDLPEEEVLTGQILREYLVKYEADSYYRNRCYMVYSALSKWADLSLPKDWRFLKGKYQTKRDRKIPTDLEIESIRESINNDAWRWVFGVLACYGLRPHEVFSLDLSRFPIVRVGENTKTGVRIIYPLSPDGVNWAKKWEIDKIKLPNIVIDEKTNKELGAKISKYFSTLKLGIVPYSLRDAYAIRGAKKNIDSLIMSKWMGHSVSVHSRHYLAYIDEVAMERIWQQSEGLELRILQSREDLEKGKINEAEGNW